MNIPLLIILMYIVFLYVVSAYATKLMKKTGSGGYLLAGRGMPTGIITVMIAGLAIGGSSTIGVAESAYTDGLSAGWYNVGWTIGAILVGLTIAKKYRQLEVTTIPELFERYYGVYGRILAVIGQIIIQLVITALQFVAGGSILAALLPDIFTFETGMLASGMVFAGVAIIGGYWAAGISNVVNVIVIYFGIFLGAFLCIKNFGGMEQIAISLPEGDHWFHPFMGMGMATVLANIIVITTQCYSAQGVCQIAFSAKDGNAAKKGFILGGLLILPIGFLSAILGVIAAAQFPGISPTLALPQVILSLTPVAAGLVLAGLWAADVSTAVNMLLGCSALVIEDVYKRFINPTVSPEKELRLSRVIVLLLSVLTFFLASQVLGIVKTLTIGLTLTTSYTVVLLFTLYAPKWCRKGSAVWTLAIGGLFLITWQLCPEIRIVPHPIYLAWPVSLLTFFAVAMLDRRPILTHQSADAATNAKLQGLVNQN